MILRTYGCDQCNHMMTVELRSDQWDAEPPECPRCSNVTYQELVAPGIVGSVRSKATDLALDIAERDYGVADLSSPNREGETPKVRYKDTNPETASTWGVHSEALSQAVALGRRTRLEHGSGLDIIKTMPDLIAESKKRSMKVW